MARSLERDATAQVAEVLHRTRARFNADGDPTDLAYVFYGDLEALLPRPGVPSLAA